MKTIKILRALLLLAVVQCCAMQAEAQAFLKIYPTAVPQSTKDILPSDDGGFLIAGMTMNQTPGDSDIYLVKTDNAGTILWTKTFGGNMPEYPNTILKASDGNYFISGFTRSFGSGMSDIWLLKVDAFGNLLWSKTFGTTGNDAGKEIIPTSDGNYVMSGHYNNQGFLMKFDLSGNVLWMQNYSQGYHSSFASVKECQNGDFVMIGKTTSSLNSFSDVLLARTNANGNMQWNKTFGEALDDEGRAMLENGDGTLTFLSADSSSVSDWDVHLRKTDASGNLVWEKIYGGDKKDVARSLQPTNDGGYIVGVTSRSFGWINPQLWMVKTDGSGNKQWEQHYGDYWHNHCYMVKQISDGGYVAVGHATDSTYVLTRMMFVRTDASGAVSVSELAEKDFSFTIFPNPSRGEFLVSGMKSPYELSIYNVVGEKIIPFVLPALEGNGKYEVDIAGQPKGIYFIQLGEGSERRTKKIILE